MGWHAFKINFSRKWELLHLRNSQNYENKLFCGGGGSLISLTLIATALKEKRQFGMKEELGHNGHLIRVCFFFVLFFFFPPPTLHFLLCRLNVFQAWRCSRILLLVFYRLLWLPILVLAAQLESDTTQACFISLSLTHKHTHTSSQPVA